MNIVIVAGVFITALTVIPVFLQLRSHPRGLFILFFAEMWERFSYYGMRGLLIFYLTQHFLFDDTDAQRPVRRLYHPGLPAAADRRLPGRPLAGHAQGHRVRRAAAGRRPPRPWRSRAARRTQTLTYQGHDLRLRHQGPRRRRSTCSCRSGQALRLRPAPGRRPGDQGPARRPRPCRPSCPRAATPYRSRRATPLYVNIFYLALALIIMGVGFLKANISSIVGQLYPQGDPRRDPGFTLYYYGINLGLVLGGGPLRLAGPDGGLVGRLRPGRRRHAGRASWSSCSGKPAARRQGRAAGSRRFWPSR